MSRRTKVVLGAVAALAVVVSTAVVALTVFAGATPGPLAFVVDRSVAPSIGEVDPVEGRSEPRPVGALARPDGSVTEFVLEEVIIHVRDAAELEAFLGRWNGQVLDSFPSDGEGQDHLVRVDSSLADPASLTEDLLATEPQQTGLHRAGDERVLRLLALAAAEWKRGTELVIDWLTEPATIESGQAFEAGDITENGAPKNVFDWSFMQAGAGMDIGVGAAWQLLQSKGKLVPSVRYMVVDRGFNTNGDTPDDSRIRKWDWGKKNTSKCSNNSDCPWHGTDVVLAAMAKVDNQYGTAGPAGPVVSRLIAVGKNYEYWSYMRRVEDMVEQERPDVVNISYTRDVNAGSAHAKKWTDRRMRHVRDKGALVVASAGNNGRSVDGDTLWLPCESTHVMCVGGMTGSGTISDGSNFGEGDSTTSVEIYGPMCVRSINDPNKSYLDFTTRQVCGTSVASPFVGGVAALVMAADPSLGPEEVRKILNETANSGGLGAKVTGSQRRVNALRAVARALGVEVTEPKVVIEAPSEGKELRHENWVDLRGKATDFMGRALKIAWDSDKDGHLADSSTTSIPKLSLGTHIITATATDSTGRTASAKVKVKVVDTPPEVKLVSPPSGLKVVEGNEVPLVATSVDPDNWTPVPDADTKWEVRRNGTVVHSATGHAATLPAGKATPGTYIASFTAAGMKVESSFTVTAIPPGQTKPVATITKPATKQTLGTSGKPRDVAFAGKGVDVEDGQMPGTRYRWTAYGAGQKKVLCTGSNVPTGAPPGGLTIFKDCSTFIGQLGVVNTVTTWVVVLEVFDTTGLVGTDSVNVEIVLAVP